jgi:signal transduction histidine kinase
MASIRTRITTAYAFALAGTMFVFSLVLWNERNSLALRDLQERATAVAELGARIIEQAGTENQAIVFTSDSLVGRQISARLAGLLNTLPDYVIVADSNRTIFRSSSVQRLSASDIDRLTTAAFRVVPGAGRLVSLDSDQVLIAVRLEDARAIGGVRRIVAGVSAHSLNLARREVFELAFVAGPIVLLVSIGIAWGIAGRLLLPVDEMIRDVEAITDGRSLHRRIPVEDQGDEIARLGVTLNAMISRLEASFAALRRFTADASHELKTPLTVLRADIERAMTVPARGTEQLIALEEALQETTRMAALVDSLLTLARADEGRFDLHRERIALEPLVRDVAETAHILGEEAGITVTLQTPQPVTVLGDQVRLRQLFLNLVTNAVKYTSRGGRVDLSLEVRDDNAVFTVQDTGIGIAGADLPFIFDRFWRVDRARSRSAERSGVGLGLAISQWIAQAHGGSISVSSRLGRGSTFEVTLPAADTASAAIEA